MAYSEWKEKQKDSRKSMYGASQEISSKGSKSRQPVFPKERE